MSNTTQTNSNTTNNSDFYLFPVGNSINSSDCVYNGETYLYVNSTTNSNLNTVKAVYFNPLDTNNFNFEIQGETFLDSSGTSSLVTDEISSYNGVTVGNTKPLGQAILDITNTNGTETEFFSLTKQPYICADGSFVTVPTYNNVNPNYSNYGSDVFSYTSHYIVKAKNEILIVKLLFTVTGTQFLNVANTSTTTPTVQVNVTNTIITKDKTAYNCSGKKVYNFGTQTLKYIDSGATFSPSTASYSTNNTIPIVLAPGYDKVYATIPLIYIPPTSDGSGQYLDTDGYTIVTNNLIINTANVTTVPNSQTISYGYFVVGVAYSNGTTGYLPSTNIYAEVLIKNIWRSPIAIYNTYSQFSVNDIYNKIVVLLWGTSPTGGTFLVTNTGTPISLIKSYSVTTVGNFMATMRAIITLYDGSYPISDFFTDSNLINTINNDTASSFNIEPLIKYSITDGKIANPATVANNPNMSYMLVNTKNYVGMTVDPTHQNVFGQMNSYFNLTYALLCGTGIVKYNSSNLSYLTTKKSDYIFGNSVSIGQIVKGTTTYNALIILPEAQFNINPTSTVANYLTVYSTIYSLFYVSTATLNTTVSTSTSTTSSESSSIYEFSPNYVKYAKVIMKVSNLNVLGTTTTTL